MPKIPQWSREDGVSGGERYVEYVKRNTEGVHIVERAT